MATPGAAMVGEIDHEDRFPFVVRIETSFGGSQSWCSAVVSRAGLVSTAAHCIWQVGYGLADWVRIPYVGADGVPREAYSDRIFMPDEYPDAMTKWAADDERKAATRELSFHRMTVHDIAFIVPSSQIEVIGFPHWATELVNEQGQFGSAELEAAFGRIEDRRAMAIGYGVYFCEDFNNREENCVSDENRRFADMEVVPSVTEGSETFAPPQIWCSGLGTAGTNPVQHGDSGGPNFVQAVDGRWIFVGYSSGGHSSRSCASSILANLDTWQEAADYYHSVAQNLPSDPAWGWEEAQMTHLLREVLESWSAPNEQAIARLATLYADGTVGFHGKWTERSEVIAAKRAFYLRWPEREFEIIPGTVSVLGDEAAGDPIASVFARVRWSLGNADTGARAEGESEVELVSHYGFDLEQELARGGQAITLQQERVLVTEGDLAAVEPAMAKGSFWDHNGSTMLLEADGNTRRFFYFDPRPGIREVGVKKGTQLFYGERNGFRYEGWAQVYSSRCGAYDYEVSGPVSEDQHRVDLYGQAPRIGADCEIAGYRDDHLVFTYYD